MDDKQYKEILARIKALETRAESRERLSVGMCMMLFGIVTDYYPEGHLSHESIKSLLVTTIGMSSKDTQMLVMLSNMVTDLEAKAKAGSTDVN